MRTLIVIPARLGSTRLPRKLLLAETGKPLIQHTVDAAESLAGGEWLRPLIAWDGAEPLGDEIYFTNSLTKFAMAKTGSHPNGTSRAAEAAAIANVEPDAVVILQADEPEIDPAHIRELVQQLEQHPEWDCATLAQIPDHSHAEYRDDRNKVKVFFPIAAPAAGITAYDFRRDFNGPHPKSNWSLHIGVYAYRTEALRRYAAAGPCERETAESLEQLRALHIGLRMGVVLVDHRGHGINTREDYDAFVKRWKERENAD